MDYPIQGVTVEELDDNEAYKKFIANQKSYKCGFVRLMPYLQILPKTYIKHAKRIQDFEVRNDDVWVASFPKCGTDILLNFYYEKQLYRH